MDCILDDKDNSESYLKLCDLKIKIVDCISFYDDIFINVYLKCDGIEDYNLHNLEILLENLYLSYNECMINGFSEKISSFLTQAISLLERMYYEMKKLLEEYPYLDDKIPFTDILDNLRMYDLDISNYPFVLKYLNMKKLIDNIVLNDIYDYKKSFCYNQSIFYLKK